MRHPRACRKLCGALAFAGASAIALSACRLIVGIDDRQVATSTATTPPRRFDFGSEACSACTDQCSNQIEACWADSVCRPIFECVARCDLGDPGCRAGCSTSANVAALELAFCQGARCADPCKLTCGGISGVTAVALDPPSVAACAGCWEAEACEALQAFAGDEECGAWAVCIFGCAPFDAACRDACTRKYPAGEEARRAVVWGSAPACGEVCALGQDFSCVGHVKWPNPKAEGPADLQVKVVGFPDNVAIGDASVTPCLALAPDCAPAGATVTSDDDGIATVTVQVTPFVGGAFTGYIEVVADGRVPALCYPSVYPTGTQPVNNATMLPTWTVPPFFKSVGVTQVPGTGLMSFQAVDCLNSPAGGVTFDVPGATVVYFKAGAPDASATKTDAAGIAVALNVPPGKVTVTARKDAVEFAVREVWVRADTATEVGIAPTD